MKLKTNSKNKFKDGSLGDEYYELVEMLINKSLKVFKNPEKLEGITSNDNANYLGVCMLLGEILDDLDDKDEWVEISFKYMCKIRDNLYNGDIYFKNSLFGGYCDVGFGAYSLYQSTSIYKKFIDSLNEIIVNNVRNDIDIINLKNDLYARDYDTISGLSGTTRYLLLFKENNKIKECIKDILCYLVKFTDDIEVLGVKVPGWYIPSKNHILDIEKEMYKNGSFNLGLSHGITGILAVLSIALMEGIEVQGQKESIAKILRDLNKFYYVNEKEEVYWPGRISFEDYIEGNVCKEISRASWCYGTPGIARAMYLAGTVINDNESIDIAIKAIEGLCKMGEEGWMLDSPTICHGYSGLLTVVHSMYMDTNNPLFDLGRKKILKKLLNFIEEESVYGFYNIEYSEESVNDNNLIKENDITLLSGVTGIILNLLLFVKPMKTDWIKHLLIY